MTPEVAAAVAEVEARIAAANLPDDKPSPHNASRTFVGGIVTTYAGEFVGHVCRACFEVVASVVEGRCAPCAAAGAAVEPVAFDDAPASWRCGWGGRPRCRQRLDQRGLCAEHSAIVKAIPIGRGRPKGIAKRQPQGPQGPQRRNIDTTDVLPTTQQRVTAEVRAAHMARWVHRIGAPVRRADAVRIAGGNPNGGSGSAILDLATERGWISRGERGAVAPGTVVPPNDHTNNTKDH